MTEQTASKVPQIRFKGFDEKWVEWRLGTVCAIGDADHWMPETTSHGIPYVMTGDFCGINEIDFENAKSISEADFEKLSKKIKPELGDILFARYASVGAVRHIHTTRKFIASYSCAILKSNDSFNSEYLFFLLQSDKIQNLLRQSINTGSQGNVGIESLKQLTCLFPDKTEQTQIGGYFRELDSLIGLHQRKHDKLVTLKKAMLQKMFPQPGTTTPEIRFKSFSGEWKSCELGEITTKIGSGKTPRGGKTGYLSIGIPLIRSQNIFNDSVNFEGIAFISDETDEDMSNSRVLQNDVLLNITGASIGRSAVYRSGERANVNQHVCIIRASGNHHSDFIQLNLASTRGQAAIDNSQAGGAREGLNFQQIGKFSFQFPSHAEQTQIGTYFRTLDSLITKHATQLQKLQQLKSACLEKMFV